MVVVADEDGVKLRDIVHTASSRRETFAPDRGAAFLEDRVKYCSEPRWELDQVRCMAKPSGAEISSTLPGWSKSWLYDGNLGV